MADFVQFLINTFVIWVFISTAARQVMEVRMFTEVTKTPIDRGYVWFLRLTCAFACIGMLAMIHSFRHERYEQVFNFGFSALPMLFITAGNAHRIHQLKTMTALFDYLEVPIQVYGALAWFNEFGTRQGKVWLERADTDHNNQPLKEPQWFCGGPGFAGNHTSGGNALSAILAAKTIDDMLNQPPKAPEAS
jgi:hypothetical protein